MIDGAHDFPVAVERRNSQLAAGYLLHFVEGVRETLHGDLVTQAALSQKFGPLRFQLGLAILQLE